jgi:two-component system, cell cycle sensor histidine kinase and response regulator CckA
MSETSYYPPHSSSSVDIPEEIAQRNLRILILEDFQPDAEFVQRELRRAQIKFNARCADSREGFLDALQTFDPDIILSDFSMPAFDAFEALDLLKQSGKDTPFILVTGSQSEEVAVRCMKAGADDYILKSTLKRLPSAVLNAVRKKDIERERERAILALKHSEEHFRSLIENALDIIIILNPDGTFRYASPSVRALGYSPEALNGKSFFDFVIEHDVPKVTAMFDSLFKEAGRPQQVEFCFRDFDESWRVLECIGKSVRIDSPTAGIVINARDITERREADERIEKLAAFPRLNPNAIFELEADARLTYCNNAAVELGRMVDADPADILPDDIEDIIEECLRTGNNRLRRETVLGSRIIAWHFFPVPENQTVHCYAVDITERVNLETQLRQAQKMDSIGQLAAGIAHDFNNVLTIVHGYSKMLLEDNMLPDDAREPIEQIAVAAQRATNLTRQLLTFSRKQMMQPQPLDMNEVVSNVTRFLRRVVGEDIALHFNYTPNLPVVEADIGMVEQLIMNLAVNARDAMPKGGTVTIGTATIEINDTHARINPEARVGKYVCLRVSDTGSGIPPEVLPRIFEPFFTTKAVGKGTGLGLATVYGVVKQHKGWVEVLSEVGRGTTFRIYLPATNVAADASGAKAVNEKNCRGNETVLVVEDEPQLRAMVCGVLRQHGYCTLEASCGPEAIPLFRENAQNIHLVVTDMVMPGNMSGRELGEILKSEKPGLRVVYSSGYSAEMFAKDSVLKRGLNFLQKPYHPSALVKIVRDCLDS